MRGYSGPKLVEPNKLAAMQKVLHGEMPLQETPRLANCTISKHAIICYEIKFFFNEDSRCIVSGQAYTELDFICGCCLRPFAHELKVAFLLAPVGHECNMLQVGECYEGIIMNKGSIFLPQVLEDELLLSLPLVLKHKDQNCTKAVVKRVDSEVRENQFQVLDSVILKNEQGMGA
jgi:uncharacterized protein